MIIDHPTWEIMGKSKDCQSYPRSPLWRLDISKSHPSTDPVVWGDTWSHRLASESQWRFSEISWGIMIFRYFQKYIQVMKKTCFVMHKVLFNRPQKMFPTPQLLLECHSNEFKWCRENLRDGPLSKSAVYICYTYTCKARRYLKYLHDYSHESHQQIITNPRLRAPVLWSKNQCSFSQQTTHLLRVSKNLTNLTTFWGDVSNPPWTYSLISKISPAHFYHVSLLAKHRFHGVYAAPQWVLLPPKLGPSTDEFQSHWVSPPEWRP
jgi:hypothetical protein